MAREVTRRETLTRIGGTLAFAGSAGTASAASDGDAGADGDVDPAAVVSADRESAYPKCVYGPADDGWAVSMPVNIHVRVPGETAAIAAIEDEFTGLSGLQWTRLFPDSPAAAWDAQREELVPPALSFRRPRLGDEWNHVHVWPVDANRAAIHAHLDVLDFSASHFHRGDAYRDAVAEVSDQFGTDRWRRTTEYDIEYGVDPDRLETWGRTGDLQLEYRAR